MPRGKKTEDLTTIQMALVGFQLEKQKIEDKIQELQGRLKGTNSAPSAAAKKAAPAGKRQLSAAARRRISKAQKKRWAAHRKAQAGKG
jgi:cell division septum initiation protein DivIVA